MTDNQPENAAPSDDASNKEVAPFSVGTALREARARLGLSVGEVSHHIKFAPRQVEALEADDFEHLPETTFLRGFVRSYARLLQLDVEPLLAALPHAPELVVSQEVKAQSEVPYPNIYMERKQNIIWLAAALVVAVALALTAWLLGDSRKEQNAQKATVSDAQNTTVETLVLPNAVPVSAVPDAASASAVPATESTTGMPGSENLTTEKPLAEKPVAENPVAEKRIEESHVGEQHVAEIKKEVKSVPAQPPAQAVVVPLANPLVKPAAANNVPGQVAIRMTFDQDSWVEITEKNGKHLLSQLNRAGSELIVNGSPPLSLVIGNSKDVHLYYKGQNVDLGPHTKVAVARLTLE